MGRKWQRSSMVLRRRESITNWSSTVHALQAELIMRELNSAENNC